jgi:hypothetical protein
LVSTVSEYRLFTVAWVAGPPSPEYPASPVPATVVMTWMTLSMRLTVWLRPSQMYSCR